jgi:AcrR family transcriptional regulator
MARPTTISNQQILEAAQTVFLEHGFANASTVEIARRAGISEGSIFNRFATKEALFDAAMDKTVPPPLTLERYIGKGDLKANLVRITVQSIDFLGALLPSLMLRWSEGDRARGSEICTRPKRILHALTGFFAHEAALGRVRGDPRIAARIFMGGVWSFCFLRTVAGDRSMSPASFARGLVAGMWQGMAPRGKLSSKPSRKPSRQGTRP